MQRLSHYIRPTRARASACSSQHQTARHISQSSNEQRTISDAWLMNPYLSIKQLRSITLFGNSKQPILNKMTIFGNSNHLAQISMSKYGYSPRYMSQMPWHQPRGVHEVPKQSPVSVEVAADETVLALLDQIYEANSAQGILDVYDQWKDKFNEVHSARALWCLSEVCGRDHYNDALPNTDDTALVKVSGGEIVQMRGFRELGNTVLRDSMHMDNKMFIFSLEAICKLDIPPSSILVQTLLEQSKSRLNTFDCNSLAHFTYVLNSLLPPTPIVNALLDGVSLRLPNVIEGATQILEVVNFMKAVGKRLPKLQQEKLVNMWYAIASIQDNTVDSMIQALKGLVGMGCNTRQCCDLAVAYLKDNINDVRQEDMVGIMVTFSKLQYHNEEFYELIGDRVADHLNDVPLVYSDSVWSINQLAHLCRVYARFRHLHPCLLNTIAHAVTHPLVKDYTMLDFAFILQPFAEMCYTPQNNDTFLSTITKLCNSTIFNEEKRWVVVEMATHLALCGRYPSKMVAYIVEQLPLVSLEKQKNAIMVANLRKLHQSLSIQLPYSLQSLETIQHHIDSIPIMSRLSPNVASVSYKRARHIVKKILTRMCSEQSSLTQNVDAGLGYTIDFVIDNGESRQAIVLRDASCYAVNIPHHALVSTQHMEEYLKSNRYQVALVVIEDLLNIWSEEDQEAYISNRITLTT